MATAAKPVLALTGASHAAGSSGWRRDEHLIDALPYIDTLSAEEKSQVESLIEEECRRSSKKPSDYLADLPAMPAAKFEGHPMLAAEYERVKSKQQMPPLDTSRYRLDPPPQTKRSQLEAWQASVNNAHAQLEHQYNRIHNLELLLKYGDKSWRAQVQAQESVLKGLEAELASTRRAIMALNQERKLSQTAAGRELSQVRDEYYAALAKNLEIEAAIEQLQKDVDVLRARALGQAGGAAGEGGASGATGAEQQGEGALQQQQGDQQQGNGHHPVAAGAAMEEEGGSGGAATATTGPMDVDGGEGAAPPAANGHLEAPERGS